MPLALAAAGSGGLRLTAVDAAARALGLRVGEPLGRVRGRIGVPLRVLPADPEADAAALARLCLWAQRYSPRVGPFGAAEAGHGLYIDVTGAAHLHGGEAGLLADLARRLDAGNVAGRLALADGAGAAYALARFGREDRTIVPPGEAEAALAPLPVEALRCEPATAAALRRLGLKRIGALAAAARAPLARRFGAALLHRLDAALGLRPEPLAIVAEPAAYGASRGFLDPIGQQEAIVAAVRDLMRSIAPRLEADGLGACALCLTLERVDGVTRRLDLGLSRPSRSPDRVADLLRLRLDRLGAGLDAGFGFESLRLDVVAADRMTGEQASLAPARGQAGGIGDLADTLRQRLGRPLIRLSARASHLPERADALMPWSAAPDWSGRKMSDTGSSDAEASEPDAGPPPRPLVLFARSEPAEEVIALAPEGPPRRFRWRARLHRVAHAEGPERIAPEWWRGTDPGQERDYYVIECEAGSRLWLYRSGAHAPDRPAGWFVHGVFA